MNPSVAVVGATGAVGELMRRVLEERNFPARTIKFLASARSAGKSVTFRGKSYAVEAIRTRYSIRWLLWHPIATCARS